MEETAFAFRDTTDGGKTGQTKHEGNVERWDFESRKYRYKNAICNSKYTCRDTGGDPHTDTITEPDTWTLQLLLLLSLSLIHI